VNKIIEFFYYKDFIELKDKNNELELFIEREKSNKFQIENEHTELKNKLRKYKESQLSNRKNQEISLRYKSQINDIFTEMQILRSQLEDSKEVQKKQDELIESLKLEIEINSKKGEKIVIKFF
jgi:hypothetical protein